MERLLVLKFDALNCSAEVWLNDFPLGRIGPAGGSLVLPVHEFTVSGPNQLRLRVGPPDAGEEAQTLTAPGDALASARLLLPRIGNEAMEDSARTLGVVEWTLPKGESYQAPLQRMQDVDLPVSFPLWRWRKAPPAETGAATSALVLAALQGIKADLERGEPASFLQLTRLRSEELAQAYQRDPAAGQQRLEAHLRALHARGALVFEELAADSLHLLPVANGRLLECRDAQGLPALRSVPDADGTVHAFPLRLALVAGIIYALR